jgi:uncharacterized membrane protein YfcA
VKYLLVFLSVCALDFVWTFYTRAMVARDELRAGLWSATIIGIGGFAASEYVKDLSFLIPAALGAFVGTWLSVRLERKNHERNA